MEDWSRRHHEASTAIDDREEKLDEIYEEIEKDLLVRSSPGPGPVSGPVLNLRLDSHLSFDLILVFSS